MCTVLLYVCVHSLAITGHGPAVTFSWGDFSPTSVPFNVPSAVILYVTPHCRSLIVTVAILLVIGAVPEKWHHVCTCTLITVFPRLIPHPRLVPQCGTIQIQTTMKQHWIQYLF